MLVSCISACARCRFCKEGHYGLCSGGGGWIFGHLIDGLQADLARMPFADTSVYKVPEGLSDVQVLFLADVAINNGVEDARARVMELAYDTFAAAAETHALKVVLHAATNPGPVDAQLGELAVRSPALV